MEVTKTVMWKDRMPCVGVKIRPVNITTAREGCVLLRGGPALPPAMQGFGTVLAKASLLRSAGCGELGDGVGGVMGARGATAPRVQRAPCSPPEVEEQEPPCFGEGRPGGSKGYVTGTQLGFVVFTCTQTSLSSSRGTV